MRPTNSQGQTPLTDEERSGLLLPVFTRAELDELESSNIAAARTWALLRRRGLKVETVLSEEWLRELHRRMYDQVWGWAGSYRTSERNLGVDHWTIGVEIRTLLDDANYWRSQRGQFSMPADEIAVRVPHRSVQIHPFPNGNGRWSRLLGDVLVKSLGGKEFSWGLSSPRTPDRTRDRYLSALKEADRSRNYAPLMAFARS